MYKHSVQGKQGDNFSVIRLKLDDVTEFLELPLIPESGKISCIEVLSFIEEVVEIAMSLINAYDDMLNFSSINLNHGFMSFHYVTATLTNLVLIQCSQARPNAE
jgi:hypothetical protein